jgi:hypothetical protein
VEQRRYPAPFFERDPRMTSGGSGNSGFSFGSLSGSARWPGLPCRIFRIVGFGLQDLIGSRQLLSITREMIDEINETVAIARALMLKPSTADMPKKLAALAARLPYLAND